MLFYSTRSKTDLFITTFYTFSTFAFLFLSLASPLLAQLASDTIFRKKKASVHYAGTVLRESLHRFADLQGVGVFLDRRIDPSQKIRFEAPARPLDQLLEELAESLDLGCFFFERVFYIGPKNTVDTLAPLLERHRKQIRTLPEPIRSKFMAEVSLHIPFLAEPRKLVVHLLEERGFRLQNPNRLPHDLWAENMLPVMPLYEILILLLIGFDLDYSLEVSDPNRTTLILTNLPKFSRQESRGLAHEMVVARSKPAPKQSTPPAVPLAQRRFSLQIEQQRLNTVMEMLAERIGLNLRWDEPSLIAKGASKETRISFDVKNVTAQELFRAALEPLGLEFRIENNILLVR